MINSSYLKKFDLPILASLLILPILSLICMPIYIYDKVTNYYGLIHSGWRGTKDKIISKALDYFIDEFNSFYSDIFIVIGPHIQKCCYEVDWDVAKYFSHSIKSLCFLPSSIIPSNALNPIPS